MLKARQHIPNFCTGIEPKIVEVETTADLLALDWVAQWEGPDDGGLPFLRWSRTRFGHLIAEYGHGPEPSKWWVVAGVAPAHDLELPWFDPHPRFGQIAPSIDKTPLKA